LAVIAGERGEVPDGATPDEMARVIVERYLESWASSARIDHHGVTENI
jgi:hypothetical protein